MSISHTIFISIHAPAEGATAKAQNIAYCNNIFQSTLPRRERLATITTKDRFGLVFQSTLPRRERRVASPMPRHSSFQFQSTLPRRERPRTWKAVLLEVIFQSTLPWRERRYRCLNCCKSCCISIHAPAEGATQFMKQTGGDIGISIHAPAEGATANIHNFFGVISEQNVHICIFSYIISFSRRINNHINKEINEFSGANRLGIYGCFIFARIFMKFLITAPLYNFFIKKYRIGLSDV